jgi:hypothetical protein
MTVFDDFREIPPQRLTDGYLARAVHGERLTLAVVEAAPGAVLPEHRHDNEQFGIVIEGAVTFRIGEEERSVGAGGIWRIPSDTPHAVTAGEECFSTNRSKTPSTRSPSSSIVTCWPRLDRFSLMRRLCQTTWFQSRRSPSFDHASLRVAASYPVSRILAGQ